MTSPFQWWKEGSRSRNCSSNLAFVPIPSSRIERIRFAVSPAPERSTSRRAVNGRQSTTRSAATACDESPNTSEYVPSVCAVIETSGALRWTDPEGRISAMRFGIWSFPPRVW